MTQNDWNQATLTKLKSLLQKGLSTAEIGKKLGMSKNAVVGKLNRLGWNAKALAETNAKDVKKTLPKPAVSTKKIATQISKKKPAATVKELPKKIPLTNTNSKGAKSAGVIEKKIPVQQKAVLDKVSSSKNLAMHQRIIQHSLEMANIKPDQCRWLIGDPDSETFHFCGKKVFTGKPYCYDHCLQAYQFQQPKKK